MDSKKEVTHTGIINSIQPNGIKVGIIVTSGCISCQIKSACTMSEQTNKELDIECDPLEFHVGQKVLIRLKTYMGMQALFLGYFLPFIVVMCTLIISSSLIPNEGIVGLVSFASVIPYYILLYLLRGRIKKRFTYVVNPLNE